MTVGTTRMMFKLTAVVSLVAAALGWWNLFGRGFTMGGVFSPALFTVLGPFWWFFALRANCCSEDSGKAKSGADA